jgi:hypothetical protein
MKVVWQPGSLPIYVRERSQLSGPKTDHRSFCEPAKIEETKPRMSCMGRKSRERDTKETNTAIAVH